MESVKSYSYVPEIDIAMYLEETFPAQLHNRGLQWGQDIASTSSSLLFQKHTFQFADDACTTEKLSSASSPKSEINGFIDTLQRLPDIDALRNIERAQLLAIIDLLGELNESSHSSAYDSLDKPGRRYLIIISWIICTSHFL